MARKQVTSNATDIKDFEGTEFSGNYIGSKTIETKLGEQVLWQFTDPKGQPFTIYGFTNLNRAMESVGINTFVWITYKGTQNVKTKYGMKDVHQVSVEVDDGQ